MSKNDSRGTLYLVPAPLDFGCHETTDLPSVLPRGTLQIAARLSFWICENSKTTRAYLKRITAVVPLGLDLQAITMFELPREVHKRGDRGFDATFLLHPVLEGHDMGLVSEAGMPAVSDPGASVVRAAHRLAVKVIPLAGPSSLLLALAASGFDGQNFAFVGYLPQEHEALVRQVRLLETHMLRTEQTQIFIETPYRNLSLFQVLIQTLQQNTCLSVSSGLTLHCMQIYSDTVRNWKVKPAFLDTKIPAVFSIAP